MRVETITDLAGFQALERSWNECLAGMPGGNPFLCHQWLRAWWDVYGRDAQLMVLVVRDGPLILAAAPLMRTRGRYYGVAMDQILFIGTETCDRLGFLCRGPQREPLRAIWRQLRASCRGRTLVRLEGVPQEHPMLAAAEGLPGLWAEETSSRLPYIPIDRTWEQYRKGLTHKFRSEMRTRPKVFAAWGDWRLDTCRGEQVRPHLDDLAAVERASSKTEADAAFLASSRNREFLGRLLAVDDPVEPVLLRLLIDDRLVAYVVGFVHGGVFCAYNTAYLPGFEKGSPGKWIMDRAVEFAFAEKLREFDFLRGQFSYKERWQPRLRLSRRRVLFASDPLGWALRAMVFEVRPRLKRLRRGSGGR